MALPLPKQINGSQTQFVIQIADVILGIESWFEYLPWQCRQYIVQKQPETWISVSMQEIESMYELQLLECSLAYCESICIFEKVCEFFTHKNIFMMHAAAIKMDKIAFLFAGSSGVGKSTHIMQWRKRYGSRVGIINGDKPFIKFDDGKFYVYGSPWCGKEGWNANTFAPLGAICFLSQAVDNSIRRLDTQDTLRKLFLQVAMPQAQEDVDQFLKLMDLFVCQIPCYELSSNVSEQAAEVAYVGMQEAKI